MTTIQPRTSVVTIYQGDYLDRIRHLEAQYDAAIKSEKQAVATLDEEARPTQLVTEHSALVSEAESSALNITLQALGRKVWRGLVAEHPPRENNINDKLVGVNEESFADVLVAKSIVEPVLSDDDLDALSDTDFNRLYLTAFALNRAPVTDPKVLRSPDSQTSPESDAT